MKHLSLSLGFVAVVNGNDEPLLRRRARGMVEENVCSTMIPPSVPPPKDSDCWKWYVPPDDGQLLPGAPVPTKGCDYEPCQNAVCACDDYCCKTAWDLSCRGYYQLPGDTSFENNFFVSGCSAKLLCCEPKSAYPDPPVGGGSPPTIKEYIATEPDTSFQCTPGRDRNCCPTMIPPSFFASDDSTCWQWWDPPADGVIRAGADLPKGCNYKPCQDAVCACDDYCCTTAWDISCRGYVYSQGDSSPNNAFVDGCSAKILCCEQETAFPQPPVGGAATEPQNITISNYTMRDYLFFR